MRPADIFTNNANIAGPLSAYGEYSEDVVVTPKFQAQGQSSKKLTVPVNHLGGESSPYLLQHAKNPVGWYAWGDDAFNAARNEDKPIFLSIGYSSDHWCHVMERECFSDVEVAGGLANGKDKVFDVGVDFKLGDGFKLGATYLHAKLDGKEDGASNNGFIASASYKGAVASKPGTWGLAAKYYHTPAGFFVAPGWEDTHSATVRAAQEGAKGFYVKADYTIAKNIRADIEYWDLKTRVNDVKSKTLFTALYFQF